ncbi:MAG: hypothetical protein PHF86_07315 [Candidatus Nanoarchaeia archaeon]|jgi:hypothetical protein|nr:hypothetical protein [Candidatus Nanoarchaeia archaeon]
MGNEKLIEKKESFKTALLFIENIIEGQEIDRFKFTPKELQSLSFIQELLSIHINEFEKF